MESQVAEVMSQFGVEASEHVHPAIQGHVGLPSNALFLKEDNGRYNTNFILAAEPQSGYDKEAYLSVFASGFGEIARQVKKMKIKEKSYVMATGRLEAGSSPGLLMLKLSGIRYAKFPKKKEKE